MAGIFLSYSRANRDHAHAVVQGLRALAVKVWWDEDMPGVEWQYELVDRITEMAAVMVLWSPQSLDSRNVRDEARLAYKQDKLINALIGVAEPREPFAGINGHTLDGWDGREPHRGWRRLVETAESFLVKAGDVEPGAIVEALDRIEAEWAALKLEHRQAVEAFSDAQVALTEALDNEEKAKAAASAANDELRRVAQLDVDRMVLGAAIAAAQKLCDERTTALALASSATHSARGKLSHASRKMKRLEDDMKRPAWAIPQGLIDPPPPAPEKAAPAPEPTQAAPSKPEPEPEPPEAAEPMPEPTPEPASGAPRELEPPTPGNDLTIATASTLGAFAKENRVPLLGLGATVGVLSLVLTLASLGVAPGAIPKADPTAIASGSGLTPGVAPEPSPPAASKATAKPGEWLIGEWVTDQEAKKENCYSRLGVAASDKDGFLRFYDPQKNANYEEEDKITILSDGSLRNTLWTYTRQPNGNITMQLRSDPKIRLELSKCGG